MSGQPGSSSGQQSQNGTTPKAIANLARRQDDVTRRGTSRMKFIPVLPSRRKKEEPTQSESKAEKPATEMRGRGRGAARGRGRGDARGGAPRTAPEMMATGPLALGPTMSGSAATKRSGPRSNFSAASRSSGSGAPASSSVGTGLTRSTVPTLKREPSDSSQKFVEVEAETYSDPDEGVEIVDMDEIRKMDWMAPESLTKEKVREKRKKSSIKREASKDKGKVKAEPQDVELEEHEEEQVDLANALDLSESEEEEEMEDIFNDFALQEEDQDMDSNVRQEKLYFFQFPEPFPTFLPRESTKTVDVDMTDATPKRTDKGKAPEGSEKVKKAVTFAPDVKPPASGASTPSVDTPSVPLDGVIGQLEIHQSGAVRMRLENGILLDVTAATQPSFLQHAVHVDMEKKKLSVIGEVNRRFVVSPDIDALLESLETAEQQAAMDVDKPEEDLIKMEEEKKEKPKKKVQK
ncbi:hypothetical protein ACEPAI_3693 [Sanghuangporus weigelae]